MTDIDWRHLPALTTLRAFEATARMKGYSAAARTLNVTCLLYTSDAADDVSTV